MCVLQIKNGQVLAGAVITINIIAGTVAMYEGGWYDPDFNDMPK
nr:hypothetical protein [Nicoletella semolina]